jgi:hypothetical protein
MDDRRNLRRSQQVGRNSALPVLREDVISRFGSGVARDPAPGVVSLRRRTGRGARLEVVGRRVVVEHRISPTAAVRESFAVFHHEIHIQQGGWHESASGVSGDRAQHIDVAERTTVRSDQPAPAGTPDRSCRCYSVVRD